MFSPNNVQTRIYASALKVDIQDTEVLTTIKDLNESLPMCGEETSIRKIKAIILPHNLLYPPLCS